MELTVTDPCPEGRGSQFPALTHPFLSMTSSSPASSPSPQPTSWLYVAESFTGICLAWPSEEECEECVVITLKPHPEHPSKVAIPVSTVRDTTEPAWGRESDLLQCFRDEEPKLLISVTILRRIFLELELRAIPLLENPDPEAQK